MSAKTYAVIGSNCFTGSHIVNALLDDPGNLIIGISRSPEYKDYFLPYKKRHNDNFRFHQIDVVRSFDRAAAVLDEVKPQVVINVAALSEVALSNERAGEYFDINTTAVVKLCEHLRTKPYLERYVHISSAEIFGNCAAPTGEDAPFNPSTPYAVSKAAADLYLKTLRTNSGYPVTVIRSTNIYGQHQQLYKIIPRTVVYLKLGKNIELHGGGRAVKSFVHIRDVVDGLMLALSCGQPGTYHFSVESEQTVSDIVRRICKLMGFDFKQATSVVSERLGQDARYWLGSSKARQELGWAPKVSFDEGVAEVIEWVESNWEQIRTAPLEYVHKV